MRERGRSFTVALPARWRPGASAYARRILARAEATMRSLQGVRQDERVTSGPGSLATTTYWLAAPDRRRYLTGRGVRSIAIGRREWQRLPDTGWRRVNASGGVPFRTRSWFRWTPYAVAVRLLALTRREANIALMDPGTPAWIRLRIDRRTGRVLSDRLITPGESLLQRYSHFNRPLSIHPPHDR
ncbi:MAG: hypothetical protein E6G10_30140 [Actinobacteria bacterium]|nr:MAG: hypothetical protein E6G10_30140 [Actinomycetota bacterium]